MSAGRSVCDAAIEVLAAGAPEEKQARARAAAAAWRAGALSLSGAAPVPPDRPARPDKPELRPPGQVPRRRTGSLTGRIGLLHALAHIEFNAIDLAFDMIARFSPALPLCEAERRAFVDDWIGVGDDEARHFGMIAARLAELGAAYGDLPAHDGLWEAALNTRDDVLARLAIAPMTLEARGLDVTPGMARRLDAAGDPESAALLDRIYRDEIGHVRAGTRWFQRLCDIAGRAPANTYQAYVRDRFAGGLKPPFNDPAREAAGLLPDFYANGEDCDLGRNVNRT